MGVKPAKRKPLATGYAVVTKEATISRGPSGYLDIYPDQKRADLLATCFKRHVRRVMVYAAEEPGLYDNR